MHVIVVVKHTFKFKNCCNIVKIYLNFLFLSVVKKFHSTTIDYNRSIKKLQSLEKKVYNVSLLQVNLKCFLINWFI